MSREELSPLMNPAMIAPAGAVLCGLLIVGVALPYAWATPIADDGVQRVWFYKAATSVERPYELASVNGYAVATPPRRPQIADGINGRVSTGCLPDQLKAALAKVQAACPGFNVISANRPGSRVRGSGRTSLHASCQAADITVSKWSCASRVLKDFPGGMSTDPERVGHIHVSMARGSREYGSRFAHWQPKRHRVSRHVRVAKVAEPAPRGSL